MAGICLPVPGTRQEAAITQMSSGHSKFPRWRNNWRRTSPTGCSCGKRKSSTYKTEYTPPPAGTARKACDPPIIKMWKGEWRESGKAAPAAKSAASAGAGASRSVLRPKAVSHRQEEKEIVGDLAALSLCPKGAVTLRFCHDTHTGQKPIKRGTAFPKRENLTQGAI